jgi:hypothetical protein
MCSAALRVWTWVVVLKVIVYSPGKKIHCVNTQGFGSAVLSTIDRDQFALSVFRQAQTELE